MTGGLVMPVLVYSTDEIDAITPRPAASVSQETFSRDIDGRATKHTLLDLAMVGDGAGVVDVDALWPGLVPAFATSLILTVERGWLAIPPGGTGSVSLRVMADGYDLSNVLDRHKSQAWVVNGIGVDVVADDVRMPIAPGRRKFFWALQSSHPMAATKMAIIDLWGWVA